MNIQEKIKLSRQVMIIAGIYSAFISLLLLLNFWHIKQNKPLESLALTALVERLASDPNDDALKQEIRNLDLLARKAYFTSQWQVRTGAYLLLFGAVVFTVALWYNSRLQKVIGKPEVSSAGELSERRVSEKWLFISGIAVLALAFGSSFLSNDYLRLYNPVTGTEKEEDNRKVEVITISGPAGDTAKTTEVSQAAQVVKIDSARASSPATKPEEPAPARLTFELLKAQHNTFRGVFGQGVSYRKNIPVSWDGGSGKNVLWKVPVTRSGFNSPVIWGNRLFIAGVEGITGYVLCYDKNTGKLLWEKDASGVPGSPATSPDVSDDTGLSAPTMAVDGKGVYAIFGTGVLIAFDMNGNRLWARALGVPDNHYGHSSSLLVWDNKLFVQYDSNRSGRMLAINVSNGESVWDVKRTNKISWASPILVQLEGKYQIVTTSVPLVAGTDPETGKELWSLDCMMGEVGPSAAFSDGIVFAANEYAKLVAIRPADPPEILWENDEYLPEASSPVAHQGLLYLATSYGVIACYDAKNGTKYWSHEAEQGFYSSPVIADGKVYVIDIGGTMHIFRLGKEKEIIAEPSLGEKAFATPVFDDNRIYLRGQKNLFSIGSK